MKDWWESGANDLSLLSEQYFAEIEELIRGFLAYKFESAVEAWEFQLRILKLQIKLQDERAIIVQQTKATRVDIRQVAEKKNGDWKNDLHRLQSKQEYLEKKIAVYEYFYKMSRHVGDAFAWFFLKEDEKLIRPLTENALVSSTSSGISLKGVLAAAEYFANKGLGFPILHDITNCLRVGDVTFTSQDQRPLTFEVKTHTKKEFEDKVEAVATAYLMQPIEKIPELGEQLQMNLKLANVQTDHASTARSKRLSGQLKRQLDRMVRAQILQTAPPEQLVEGLEEWSAITYIGLETRYFYWNKVTSVIERAKKDGYASLVVDDAFMYIAIYNESPFMHPWQQVDEEKLHFDLLEEDIKANLPKLTEVNKNVVWFGWSWDYLLKNDLLSIRPFLLQHLPVDHIVDMVRGKLLLIVEINLGVLAEAVNHRGAGLNAVVTTNERVLIEVTTNEFELKDGFVARCRLGSLNDFGLKIVHEYLSMEGFVQCVLRKAQLLMKVGQEDWERNPEYTSEDEGDSP